MAWGISLYMKILKKRKIIRGSLLLDFGIYVGYWLGPRSNSYQALNILLHISMKNFWFQIAFYSVLLDARCQTSNLLTCTIPCFFGF